MLLSDQLLIARQQSHILYAEIQKSNARFKDSSLSSEASSVVPISLKQYLKCFNTLKGHRDKVVQVKWGPDSTRVVSTCQDGFMIVWDTLLGFKLQAVGLDNSWVLCCAFSPLGRYVALAGLDNRCTIYKVTDPYTSMYDGPGGVELQLRLGQRTPRAHAAYVSACEFLADEKVLTASGDMTIALWDMEKDVRLAEYLGHMGDVLLLLIPPHRRNNPQTFFSSGADGYVKMWDLRAQCPPKLIKISNLDVNTVAAFHNDYLFATGADDGLCRLYDMRCDCELEQYNLGAQFLGSKVLSAIDNDPMATPDVLSVDVSVLGRILYACYADYGCIAWDTLRNAIVEHIRVERGGHRGRIMQVAVSPDGEGVATASWDETVKIWLT